MYWYSFLYTCTCTGISISTCIQKNVPEFLFIGYIHLSIHFINSYLLGVHCQELVLIPPLSLNFWLGSLKILPLFKEKYSHIKVQRIIHVYMHFIVCII